MNKDTACIQFSQNCKYTRNITASHRINEKLEYNMGARQDGNRTAWDQLITTESEL